MTSSKCPNCGLVQWAQAETCKRCGGFLEAGKSDQSGYRQEYSSAPGEVYAADAGRRQFSGGHAKSGLAIASMVLAIIAFPTALFLIGLVLAPVAVILGIVALRKASKNPAAYGGKGFAIAGVALGSVVCVLVLPIVAAIAIPNLLAAKKAANEGSALNTMEEIALAQDKHAAEDSQGICGDLKTLFDQGLIDVSVASGKVNGYTFMASGDLYSPNGCEVRGTPASSSDGARSFYFSSVDNQVRVAMDGGLANRSDPTLRQSRAAK